jgi:hypothetical protein
MLRITQPTQLTECGQAHMDSNPQPTSTLGSTPMVAPDGTVLEPAAPPVPMPSGPPPSTSGNRAAARQSSGLDHAMESF